jgi:hypothetical protein
MLLFHSDDDGSIPVAQAERMAVALTQNKVHHRFLPFIYHGSKVEKNAVMASGLAATICLS